MLKSKIRLLTNESESRNKRKFFLLYTALFVFLLFFVFYNFIVNGITFVRWGDGYWQHYTCLEYYGKWLRSIAYTLFNEHRLVIPSWDFSIGLGSDVLTTFSYYAMGDPLAALSVLVPVKYTSYLFCFLSVLRHYLAGLFFSLYCFERKQKDTLAVAISTFVYVFGSFAVSASTKHPYFINAMIYLPVIFICVEKILKNKNPIYLSLIVCIAAVSNFYFFYVLAIATVIYVFLRLFAVYKKDIKAMIAPFIKIAVSSVIGVIMGMIVFLPTVYRLFTDSRISVDTERSLFYPLAYYLRIPAGFVTYNYCGASTLFGYSVITVFALVALFMIKKKYFTLKLSLIICAVGFLFPAFGSLANGFSYPTNRWMFVFSFALSFALCVSWEELFTASKKRTAVIAALPVIYAALCFLTDQTVIKNMLLSTVLILAVSALIIINRFFLENKPNLRKYTRIAVAVVSLISIIINSQFTFAYLGKYYTPYEIRTFASGDSVAVKNHIKEASPEGFFRYTGDYLAVNDNVRKGLSNTQQYWSFSNASVSDFQNAVNLNEPYYQWVNGFDEITSINTLSSVRYYYDSPEYKTAAIPYGYTATETENLYENTYYLPVGYTYDSYITREYFNSLPTSLDKQQAMLQGVVLEEATDRCENVIPEFATKQVDFKMLLKDDDVTFDGDHTFTVTKEGATLYFAVRPEKNSEFYLSVKDISYEGIAEYSIYTDDAYSDPGNLYDMEDFYALDKDMQEEIRGEAKYFIEEKELDFDIGVMNDDKEYVNVKKLTYFTPEFDFYCGKTSFDVNLGYTEDGYSYVAIKFPFIGKYTIGDISFMAQSMGIYTDSVNKLGEEALQNVVFDDDVLTGDITVSGNKILCLSIPYSAGWTAYVDGVETEIIKANVMYSAIHLTEGEHKVELRYSTPALNYGIILTIFGIILLLLYYLWYYIGRKKNCFTIKEID